MASDWCTQEGASLTRPPGFNGKDYAYWKERMRIFIEGVDIDIWDAVENGPFVPTHMVNGVLVVKERNEWTDNEKRKVQRNHRAKNIITSALSPDEFFRVSNCKTAQEMWDNLQVTYEGTSEVKRARTNTLVREYELFRMNQRETIPEMQKRFTHIVNQLSSLGKSFPPEDLINKVLRCLNREWQPKVTAIVESRNLATMTLATLFGKLQEHELELARLAEHEEKGNKKKSLALKVSSSDQSDDSDDSEYEDDEDEKKMERLFRKFKKFMRRKSLHRKNSSPKRMSSKKNFPSPPNCYECGKSGHMKMECPNLQRKVSKFNKKGSKGNNRRKAYIAWEDSDIDSSDNSESEEDQLALMANNESEGESEIEVDSNSETSQNAYDELHEAFLELHDHSLELAKALKQSKKAVAHLQKEVIDLTKERLELRNENHSLSCFKANYVCDKCAEYEKKIHELEWTIGKMSNMQHVHARSPRNNFEKRHVHHRPKFTTSPYIRCYYCAKLGHTASVCMARRRQVVKKVWVPKRALPSTNPQGPKEIWVPKLST